MDPSELFSVYVLLVSSKEVLVSSPEVEARSAAVYGKRGLDSGRAGRRSTFLSISIRGNKAKACCSQSRISIVDTRVRCACWGKVLRLWHDVFILVVSPELIQSVLEGVYRGCGHCVLW